MVVEVEGADLMDGTPILDIKPYLPYVDCMPDARGGFADRVKGYALEVEIPEKLLLKLPNEQQGMRAGNPRRRSETVLSE